MRDGYEGAVTRLSRWPVKSFAGESLRAARLDQRGLGGDRTHALVDGRARRAGKLLNAKQAPRMLAWSAAYPEAPDDTLDPAAPPLALVRSPDGRTWRWDEPGLAEALAADLGFPVGLRRDVAGQQDRGPTVLLTIEATRQAAERALGRPLEVRRFRSNLHLELDAPAFAEEAWVGRRVTAGEVVVELTETCYRCAIPTWDPDRHERWPELFDWLLAERDGLFGVVGRVVTPGRVAVGDPVTVSW